MAYGFAVYQFSASCCNNSNIIYAGHIIGYKAFRYLPKQCLFRHTINYFYKSFSYR